MKKGLLAIAIIAIPILIIALAIIVVAALPFAAVIVIFNMSKNNGRIDFRPQKPQKNGRCISQRPEGRFPKLDISLLGDEGRKTSKGL